MKTVKQRQVLICLTCAVSAFCLPAAPTKTTVEIQTTDKKITFLAKEQMCPWECEKTDSNLLACEAKCSLEFLDHRPGQLQCQNVCAKQYVTCLEYCSVLG